MQYASPPSSVGAVLKRGYNRTAGVSQAVQAALPLSRRKLQEYINIYIYTKYIIDDGLRATRHSGVRTNDQVHATSNAFPKTRGLGAAHLTD